jgi:hypothetical protein
MVKIMTACVVLVIVSLPGIAEGRETFTGTVTR